MRRLVGIFLALFALLPCGGQKAAVPVPNNGVTQTSTADEHDPQFVMEGAALLLHSVEKGNLRLLNHQRDLQQLRTLANRGDFPWNPSPARSTTPSRHATPRVLPPDLSAFPPPIRQGIEIGFSEAEPSQIATKPSRRLLEMLNLLATKSSPQRPFVVISLLRPPYRTAGFLHAGPMNPHSNGLACDIHSYGGYSFAARDIEDSVQGFLAVLRDLPQGRYRMGVPKAPVFSFVVGKTLYESERVALDVDGAGGGGVLESMAAGAFFGFYGAVWPFFPPEEPLVQEGLVQPKTHNEVPVLDAEGKPVPQIARFANERYADESGLNDQRLREALTAARKRGVDVIAMFPDGRSHLHVDVREFR